MNRALLAHTWRANRWRLLIVAVGLLLWGACCRSSSTRSASQFQELVRQRRHPAPVRPVRRRRHLQPDRAPSRSGSSTRSRSGSTSCSPSGSRPRRSPASASAGRSRSCSSRPLSRRGVYLTLAVAARRRSSAVTIAALIARGARRQRRRPAGRPSSASANLPILWLNGALLFWAFGGDRAARLGLVRPAHARRSGISLAFVLVSYFLDVLGSLWPDAEVAPAVLAVPLPRCQGRPRGPARHVGLRRPRRGHRGRRRRRARGLPAARPRRARPDRAGLRGAAPARLDGAARTTSARSSAARHPGRERRAGLGVAALSPAAQQQPDDHREVALERPSRRRGPRGRAASAELQRPASSRSTRGSARSTSSGGSGSSALLVTMNQPSSTATGARSVICQSMKATALVVEQGDVGELEVAVEADRGQSPERRDQRRRVGAEPRRRGRARRPARAGRSRPSRRRKIVADRVAVGGVAGGRPAGEEGQPLGQRAPRRRRRARRSAARRRGLAPRQRVEQRDPVDQAIGRRRRRGRARGRPLPGRRARSRGPASGSPPRPSPSTRRAEVGGRARAGGRPPATPSRDPGAREPRLADLVVARRRGRSSRVAGDVRLRTNRSSPRSSVVKVAPDQPSVGKRPLGDAGQAVLGEQVRERAVAPAGHARRGAALSTAPGRRARRPGPPSMYSTCESGQFRVRTTTSGSVAEAFSSTWISPAGM